MSRRLSLALLAALLAWGCSAKGPLAIGRVERARAGDIEVVEAELMRGKAGNDEHGRLIALYFDPNVVKASLVLNESAADLADVAREHVAVVNAGFFTPERRATGLLVAGGKSLSPFVREGGAAGSGVFLIDGGRPMLIARDRFSRADYAGVSLAVQAGPRIIESGGLRGIKSDDGERANRTVVGRDKRGLMVIAVLLGPGGWQSGPTLFETQAVLGEEGIGRVAKELALDFALNLDGGPSTGLHLRAPSHPIDVAENAPVFSVITLQGAR